MKTFRVLILVFCICWLSSFENNSSVNCRLLAGHGQLDVYYYYDHPGHLIATAVRNPKYIIYDSTIYFYEGDRLIKALTYRHKDGPRVYAVNTWRYNSQGILAERKEYDCSETTCDTFLIGVGRHWTYKYDDMGELIEIFENDKKQTMRITYTYDSQRNFIEASIFRSGNIFAERHRFEYDRFKNPLHLMPLAWCVSFVSPLAAHGVNNIVKIIDYDSIGKIVDVTNIKYQYNKQGYAVKRTMLYSDRRIVNDLNIDMECN